MKAIFLNVYDRDLNFLGVIDSYSSLRWRRKYFEAGEFELGADLCRCDTAFVDRCIRSYACEYPIV